MIRKVQVSASKQREYRSLDVEILQETSLVIFRPVKQEKGLNTLIAGKFITLGRNGGKAACAGPRGEDFA